jgi:hypothetical protein
MDPEQQPEPKEWVLVRKVDHYSEFEDHDTLPTRDPNLPVPKAIIPQLIVPEEDIDDSDLNKE